MLRQITPVLLAAFLFPGCEKLIDSVMKSGGSDSPDSSEATLQIQSPSGAEPDPEVVIAFNEISRATHAHNRVLIERLEKNQPANGPAYSAGILLLDKAGRQHGGLTKQIVDAVAAAVVYEKGIFVVFDTMDRQIAGMKTRGGTVANQRRGYIQIVDSGIRAYDRAILHLEKWEEPLLLKQFDRKKVPREVSEEFFRLKRISGAKISEVQKEMFRERKAALQSYRTALIQTNQANWNKHLAEANRHDQNAVRLQARMVAEIRKQLKSSSLL